MSGGLGTLASLPDSQIPPSASLGQDGAGRKHCVSLGLPGTPSTVPSESGDPKQHLFTCSTASGRPCEGEEGFLQTYSGDCRQNQSPRESPSSRPAALHRSELESPELALGPTHPSHRPIELPFKHILIQRRPEPDRPGGAGPGPGAAWSLLVA